MQNNKSKTIKGLSIANICLSAIWMVLIVILGVILVACIQSPEQIIDALRGSSGSVYDHVGNHNGHGSLYGYSYDYDFDSVFETDGALDSQVLVALLGVGIAFVLIGFIMQAFCLVASIIMMVNCDKPQKLGMVFGWGIAGAILSFITTGLASTVMFVLATIFAYQDRQLYMKGLYTYETRPK